MKRIQKVKLVFLISTIFISRGFALNYTINFTGKGASNTVERVVVQNLTRGTTATVLGGQVLNLSDEISSIEQITTNNDDIHIYTNQPNGKINISFLSKNAGNAQINVYSIDGKKILATNSNLPIGENSFQLLLPNGLFAIQVIGNGYKYSEKIITQNSIFVKQEISYIGSEKKSSLGIQKIKNSGTVSLIYYSGDLLLYKGSSGNYATIVTDIPTASKAQNFDFVECRDASGNYYSVVKIGSQTWMAENIKTSKFRNGDDIMNLTNNTDWGMYAIGSWCNYNHDALNEASYGKLYNWYAVSDARSIAPLGWHVASDIDWTTLTTFLGGESVSGGKLKQTDIVMWSSPNTLATNETGFTAIPGGSRLTTGQFNNIGLNGYWWSSTDNGTNYAWYRYMYKGSASVVRDYYNKNVGFSVRCVKDADMPTVTTNVPTSISYTTAIGGGDISSDGGAAITARGVCWSTTINPTISNNKSTAGTGTGTFTSQITGLNVNTTYYVRAYATNASGTAYGEQLVFNSKPYDALTATDADGNLYHTVTIGNQVWMVENLKTTKYRNGDIIGTTSSVNTDLSYANNPKYQWAYNGNESYVPVYGRLYTWHAVADSRNLAPEGWHVASDADWNILQNYLIANGYNYDKTTVENRIAKSLCSTTLWNTSSNTGATGCDLTLNNASGFSMTPSGYRGYDGYFYLLGSGCDLWTTTEYSTDNAIYRAIGYSTPHLQASYLKKNYGFAVRCVKNTAPTLITNLPTSILTSSVNCGGNITSDGGDAITEYGVCWSKTVNPTVADSKKLIGSGSGTFTSTITGLDLNTTYYLRAYAINSLGTSYGQQVSFKTLATDPVTVTDADGNLYHTVTIGTQTWMVENLKTTKYRNGDIIGTTSSIYTDITYVSSPKYQWACNGGESYVPDYGRLYTWYAVTDSRNLAPDGWHVASTQDWTILQNYLIANGYNYDYTTVDNKIAKSLCSTSLWNTNSTVGTPSCIPSQNNASGFSSVPSGYRGYDGYYYLLGNACYFWTSTEYSLNNAEIRSMGINNVNLMTSNSNKSYGFSVRCVKD